MKKANTGAPAGETISVAVVSFGNDPIALTLAKGATVADALAKAGITRGSQEIFVSGEVAEDADELEDKDVVSIVTPKQAGA